MKNTQTNNQKGYIIKDTITNNQTGQILVYFTGVDGYVQEEAKYCDPYKRKGCALNNVRKSAYYWDDSKKEGDDFLNYIEGGRWVHQVEIIEIELTK